VSAASVESFADTALDPPVRGFVHRPASPSGDGLVFTHGAGGNARGPLLVTLAEAFAGAGFTVLRCDLPFRQARSFGPPRPNEAERDRQGLKNAVAALRQTASGRMFLGGQSYGGRQATMLAAEDPELADGLVLTSYPLHPPGRPDQLRTQHFPNLRTPVLFVEGTRDPFAAPAEIEAALKLIPAKTSLLRMENVGHDLGFRGKSGSSDLAATVLAEFHRFFR